MVNASRKVGNLSLISTVHVHIFEKRAEGEHWLCAKDWGAPLGYDPPAWPPVRRLSDAPDEGGSAPQVLSGQSTMILEAGWGCRALSPRGAPTSVPTMELKPSSFVIARPVWIYNIVLVDL